MHERGVSGRFNFPDYLGTLVEHRKFIVVFCLSAILTSLALTYVTAEKYLATASLAYKPAAISVVRQKYADAFGSPVPAPPFAFIGQTLNDAIGSDAVLSAIVKELRLDEKEPARYASWYERWYGETKSFVKERILDVWELLKFGRIYQESAEIQAIKRLRGNLSIKRSKDSSIFLIIAKDKYPERAAKIVDSAAKHLELWAKNNTAANAKLQVLHKQKEEKLAQLNGYLSEREELLKQFGVASVADEIDTGTTTLYGFLAEHEALRSQIEEKSRAIAELVKAIDKSATGHVNPDDLKRLKSEKLFAEIAVQGLIAKQTSLGSSMEQLKKQLDTLTTLQNKVENLNIQIESTRINYVSLNDLYIDAQSESTVGSAELRILHAAYVPDKPMQPIKIYHVGLTALLALCLSIGMAYVLAYFNIKTFMNSQTNDMRQDDPAVHQE